MGESDADLPSEGLKLLGKFLRSKRKSIAPEGRGITTNRRRLVPGLSREETAALADIGASWYARLEAGRVPNPSLATMRAIARALQLNAAEETFALQLAGILPQSEPKPDDIAVRPLAALLDGGDLVSMSLWDRYLAPKAWNAVADAMYGLAHYPDPVQRNPIVHLEDPAVMRFFGDEFEPTARNLVGMFRRAYSTGEPTDYARQVYALGSKLATFQKFWGEHLVSDAVSPNGRIVVRHHAVVGKFSALPLDLLMPDEARLRILSPADEESREKFERLRAMGTPFVSEVAVEAAN